MAKSASHDIRAALHGAGLRATPARVAVVEVLRRAKTPLTHAEVANVLDRRGWDRATIFRNLIALVEAGFVTRTDLGDHVWRFGVSAGEQVGGEIHEHPHFLCTECGAVSCMPHARIELPRGAKVPKSVRTRTVEIQVRGLCDDCV
jgi:Fur family ferric uptake transcriptional regulator